MAVLLASHVPSPRRTVPRASLCVLGRTKAHRLLERYLRSLRHAHSLTVRGRPRQSLCMRKVLIIALCAMSLAAGYAQRPIEWYVARPGEMLKRVNRCVAAGDDSVKLSDRRMCTCGFTA